MSINWNDLTEKFCCNNEGQYVYSSDDAKNVISQALGKEFIEDAVNFYVYNLPEDGSELARLVLSQLKSDYAVDYIFKLYSEEQNIEYKTVAIELFRFVVTKQSLKYYPLIIKDQNLEIRKWASYTLDQLLYQNIVDIEDISQEIEDLKEINVELYNKIMKREE